VIERFAGVCGVIEAVAGLTLNQFPPRKVWARAVISSIPVPALMIGVTNVRGVVVLPGKVNENADFPTESFGALPGATTRVTAMGRVEGVAKRGETVMVALYV